MISIYEHDKVEITEYLKEEPRALLVDLRTRLIKECCALFQEYQGKIPFERRKKHTKIEDIYITGYSIVSKIAHKNLAKIFRNFEISVLVYTGKLASDTDKKYGSKSSAGPWRNSCVRRNKVKM